MVVNRPRRLYYDEKRDKYFYIVKGKRKYLKIKEGMTQKQIQKVNLVNIIGDLDDARRRKPRRKTKRLRFKKKITDDQEEKKGAFVASTTLPVRAEQTPLKERDLRQPTKIETPDIPKWQDLEKGLKEQIKILREEQKNFQDFIKSKEKIFTSESKENNERKESKEDETPRKPPSPTPSVAPSEAPSEAPSIQTTESKVDEEKKKTGRTPDKIQIDERIVIRALTNVALDTGGLIPSLPEKETKGENMYKVYRYKEGNMPEFVEALNEQLEILGQPDRFSRLTTERFRRIRSQNADKIEKAVQRAQEKKEKKRQETEKKKKKSEKEKTEKETGIMTMTELREREEREESKKRKRDESETTVETTAEPPKKGRGDDMDGLYSDEIQNHMKKKVKRIIPVVAMDELDTLLDDVKYLQDEYMAVINTDVSTGPGKHWVCIYIDNKDSFPSAEFFDPLGDPCPKPVRNIMKKLCQKMNPENMFLFKENLIKNQSNDTETCGHFVMKFLQDRHSGVPFSKATYYDKYMKKCDNDFSGEGEKKIKKFSSYM